MADNQRFFPEKNSLITNCNWNVYYLLDLCLERTHHMAGVDGGSLIQTVGSEVRGDA